MKLRLTELVGAAIPEGSPVRVTAKDAAVYAGNLMARDAGASTLGDDDPVFKLQPGAMLTTAGEPVKNSHGVSFTPVTVPGRDGLFFIHSSSIGPAGGVVVTSTTRVDKVATPWWQWALLAVGGGAVVYGGYRLYRERRKRS